MNITEAGVVNSPSESGTNDNPCFNDTQLKETFLMRRTTATTDYLKECMGHSEGQNVTEGYIGRTPLDKMFEYNNALLDLNHAKPKQLENVTAKDIKKMSKKEMAALLAKLVEE